MHDVEIASETFGREASATEGLFVVRLRDGSTPSDHLDIWYFFRADFYDYLAHNVLPRIRELDGIGTIEAAGKTRAAGERRHTCIGAP